MTFHAHFDPQGVKITKMLRVMKLTTIILVVTCISVSANTYGQKVTLSEKNVPLEKIDSVGFAFRIINMLSLIHI